MGGEACLGISKIIDEFPNRAPARDFLYSSILQHKIKLFRLIFQMDFSENLQNLRSENGTLWLSVRFESLFLASRGSFHCCRIGAGGRLGAMDL
ncbi:MAG: hypothetical protein K2H08_10510 [Duncaniella sp.]|nr:hypothetical protein [Duncaniella sp.]